jgi:uncharacterized phage-associated protein
MHSAVAVANHFLTRAAKTLEGGKLQGLVYFAHGLRLALVNLPLVDETLHANADGVVVPSLSRLGIDEAALVRAPLQLPGSAAAQLPDDAPAITTIDLVWNRFGSFSSQHLAVFVRGAGGPWDEAWNNRAAGAASVPLPNSKIRQWFRELVIQENRDLAAADGLDKTVLLARMRGDTTSGDT